MVGKPELIRAATARGIHLLRRKCATGAAMFIHQIYLEFYRTLGAGLVLVSAFYTVLMAMIVVSINRLVWRRLYTLAATRFKLET